MDEYIDRETALQLLNRNSITKKLTLADGVSIYDTIKNMPTADVAEVRHGEWIPIPEYENKRCSVCSAVFSDFTLGYYCPKCGAKMDGKEVANSG